jgi:Arc/MetJ-type ribon-helix-helix transcriptional regulator
MTTKTLTTKTKKVPMTRFNVYLPSDTADFANSSSQWQSMSDLIRHGLDLVKEEQESKKEKLAQKRMSLAGAAGNCGDPLAWSKINDIYDF